LPPKTQLLTTFAHVATFTSFFWTKKKKKKRIPKANWRTTLPHGQRNKKLYFGITKYHISKTYCVRQFFKKVGSVVTGSPLLRVC